MRFLTFVSIFISTEAQAAQADYGPALDAAKHASLIQSGVQARIDQVRHKAEAKGTEIMRSLGVDQEFGAAAFAYRCYRDQSLRIPVGTGKVVTLRPTGADLVYTFPFPWK